MKKATSIILTLVMVLSLASMAAFAAEPASEDGCDPCAVTPCVHMYDLIRTDHAYYNTGDNIRHTHKAVDVYLCRICSNQKTELRYSIEESHDLNPQTYLYDEGESGEWYYYYFCTCNLCSWSGVRSFSERQNIE